MNEPKSPDAGAWTLVVPKRTKKFLAKPESSEDTKENATQNNETPASKDQNVDPAYDAFAEYDADFEESGADNVIVDVPTENPTSDPEGFVEEYDEYAVIEDKMLDQAAYDFEKREKALSRFGGRKHGTIAEARDIRMQSVQRIYLRDDKKAAY
ncbi:hypothetical protein K4K49_012333 [Colletotrichum sp. SAR 10_70]|nr:hypothetical protein K4K50_005454 [Colletotrichum sp. SAR 10_71]KAI8189785.1 hypothetical protein K4K49_012333 [Colletotrichum sp. SAR 10_70]KAI8211494.1 hypothetical protein K4K52_010349 [Colletotrichum sp. SAR 10_76]